MGSMPQARELAGPVPPCEDTKKTADLNQKAGSHQEPHHAGRLTSEF